jgi:hypothetical protein
LAQIQNPPRELNPRQVLLRFGIRISILTVFAAFGSVGFGRSLAALLAMSAILCSVVAAVRREAVFSRSLNHWDEAVIYAALYFLCVAIDLSSPF